MTRTTEYQGHLTWYSDTIPAIASSKERVNRNNGLAKGLLGKITGGNRLIESSLSESDLRIILKPWMGLKG